MSTTKKIVLSALLMALTVIATMFIRIPLPLGYVNLGDAFVLLSVFLLGPIYGTVSAGLGSALADLFGYITYAPGTLVIKTAMALVSYLLYAGIIKATKNATLAEIIGGSVGVIIMAFGYFFYEILFFATPAVAIVNVPWNLLQGSIGVAIATAVMKIFGKWNFNENNKA